MPSSPPALSVRMSSSALMLGQFILQCKLIDLLNERGLFELAKADNLTVVEREKLDDVLQEQELSLSDL